MPLVLLAIMIMMQKKWALTKNRELGQTQYLSEIIWKPHNGTDLDSYLKSNDTNSVPRKDKIGAADLTETVLSLKKPQQQILPSITKRSSPIT